MKRLVRVLAARLPAPLCEIAIGDYAWGRRLLGGRWERWWVDSPVCGDIWHWRTRERTSWEGRPSPLCRGTPIVEEWP